MSSPHPHPYHAGSQFGPGPRRPLDREQRARFRFLLTAYRRARRLTPHAELVGNALVKRLSVDGQCDPGHDTIASDVGCCARTVRRALDALKALGLLVWQRRIARAGWRVEQISNSYFLVPLATANLPEVRAVRCGGQLGRGTRKKESTPVQRPALEVSPQAQREAAAALARVAAARAGAVQERLLKKGGR